MRNEFAQYVTRDTLAKVPTYVQPALEMGLAVKREQNGQTVSIVPAVQMGKVLFWQVFTPEKTVIRYTVDGALSAVWAHDKTVNRFMGWVAFDPTVLTDDIDIPEFDPDDMSILDEVLD